MAQRGKQRNTTLKAIQERQEGWAAARAIRQERPDYVAELGDNLFLGKLTSDARSQIEQGDGAELEGQGQNPPKMHALASSSALATNVFDYWMDRDRTVLQEMLRLKSRIGKLTFEYKCQWHPVGPNSPNIDVALKLEDGSLVAMESKFAEPFRTKTDRGLKDKYFANGKQLWTDAGLPAAQRLAGGLRQPWKWLDAPQLLKHMLGLAHEKDAREITLLCLWYDPGTDEAREHANEIRRFAMEVAGDRVHFRSLTYQELFQSFKCKRSIDRVLAAAAGLCSKESGYWPASAMRQGSSAS